MTLAVEASINNKKKAVTYVVDDETKRRIIQLSSPSLFSFLNGNDDLLTFGVDLYSSLPSSDSVPAPILQT